MVRYAHSLITIGRVGASHPFYTCFVWLFDDLIHSAHLECVRLRPSGSAIVRNGLLNELANERARGIPKAPERTRNTWRRTAEYVRCVAATIIDWARVPRRLMSFVVHNVVVRVRSSTSHMLRALATCLCVDDRWTWVWIVVGNWRRVWRMSRWDGLINSCSVVVYCISRWIFSQ